jgi:hypothetical protein
MEHPEILTLWKSYEQQLEQSLQLNRENTVAITKLKTSSALASMKPMKIFTILMGLAWTGFGIFIIFNLAWYAYAQISIFFLVSAGLQVLFTATALIIYIYQLILINQMDLDGPILEVQEGLASLKSSTLWSARILFLQLPLWTTFYWSENMFKEGPAAMLIIQLVVTLIFTCIAAWLFINIRYENRDKKWFRLIFNGNEWTQVLKSIEMLRQIKAYKN